MIDVAGWLASRTPVPRAELSTRIAEIARGRAYGSEHELAEFFIGEAKILLGHLRDDRGGAFDLLVADALITYAMEAAASDHDSFDSTAKRAMEVISTVTHRGGQP